MLMCKVDETLAVVAYVRVEKEDGPPLSPTLSAVTRRVFSDPTKAWCTPGGGGRYAAVICRGARVTSSRLTIPHVHMSRQTDLDMAGKNEETTRS